MNSNSTPMFNEQEGKEETQQKVVVPSQRTLDLLKSFARSYYADKSLPIIEGFVMN